MQPHIRPTTQRLPTLDAWNATIQHQLTNTISCEAAYIGNKGTHVFAGDGPTYNINNPLNAGVDVAPHGNVPQVQRRPLYNQIFLSRLSRSLNNQLRRFSPSSHVLLH